MKASHVTPQEVMHCIPLLCSNEKTTPRKQTFARYSRKLIKSYKDLQSYPEEWQ
jgi:hypothetical protein